ncbi:hypothetical protein ACFPT7_10275 [Acidicapsa dinghuensis]|uniref:Uncharacterized protein n=1 Tax=Acidicapsa dinghuensis TaxID=2218256 RepID=A0ABW1EEI0_9BACT|nr:hypothetical protein [Acidicapsa dinghuensis]
MNFHNYRRIPSAALVLLATAATGLWTVNAVAQAASGNDTAASCGQMPQGSVPTNQTIIAKSLGMDSGHLKPGKEIWFKNAKAVAYPGCTIEVDGIIYAKVVSVNSTKDGSEFSLDFGHADCAGGHDKQPFKMRLISLMAPEGEGKKSHNDTPSEVSSRGGPPMGGGSAGGGAPQSHQSNSGAADTTSSTGSEPNTIQPGSVVGIPATKLEPMGGTGCSDRITSTNSKIKLQPDSQFVLVVTDTK